MVLLGCCLVVIDWDLCLNTLVVKVIELAFMLCPPTPSVWGLPKFNYWLISSQYRQSHVLLHTVLSLTKEDFKVGL